MNELIDKIIFANDIGYVVKFSKFGSQYRTTCIYKDNTARSSVIPIDHITDKKIMDIIDFNIKKHKYDISKSSSR